MKKETVIGIIGKTHGVKIDAMPNPKAESRKVQRSSGAAVALKATGAAAGFAEGAAAVPTFTSLYPAGAANAGGAGADESIATVNDAVFLRGGKHCLSSQA